MTKITFRNAKKADLNELVEIENAVYGDAVYDIHRLNKQDLKDEKADSTTKFIVMEVGGKIAGYVLVDIAKDDPSAANIDSLAVAPDFAGKNFEPLLIAEAERLAVKAGFKAMTIQEPETAADALKLLHREGYKGTTLLERFYGAVNGRELSKVLVAKEEEKATAAHPRAANGL